MSFLLAASLLVPAQEPPGDEDTALAIRALEHAWVEGQSRNDNRALSLVFDNALVYVEYGNLMTKGEYLSRVRATRPRPQEIVMGVMTVRTFGSTAIVVGTYRENSAGEGKTLQKRWRFIDTWINKKGSWLLVAAASAPLSR